jgi:hypothetical protein
LSLIASVPELALDRSLQSLVIAINQPHTPLFSVGCAGYQLDEDAGQRLNGYIEFVYN